MIVWSMLSFPFMGGFTATAHDERGIVERALVDGDSHLAVSRRAGRIAGVDTGSGPEECPD